MAVDPVIVEENKLAPLLAKLSESSEEALKSLASDDSDLEFPADEDQEKPEEVSTADVDDAPVVRFIQKMLLDA
ncbi:MAG: type IV-A pilus assembly ATPase PilB, partial [Rhodoferax sp.]|nr:type IV-A pilus assembly ATPase PilB [Rhodoferax sp.]